MMLVPTMLHRIRSLSDEVRQRYDVSSLRFLMLGAAAVPYSLKVWAQEHFGPQLKVFETYAYDDPELLKQAQDGAG